MTSKMAQINEERVSNLKWNLENWREIVVLADRLLSWEQEWFAAVVAGFVSLAYLFVWWWDPTCLTLFAFAGLFVTLADYLGPKIISKVFGQNSWNGVKEKHFDLVCEKLSSAVTWFESTFRMVHDVRSSKPVAHFVVTLMILFSLAWIGNKINNLFLAYAISLGLALLPGLLERRLIQKYFANTLQKFEEMVKTKTVSMKKAE